MSHEEASAWHARVTADPKPTDWAVELDGRFIGTGRLNGSDSTDMRPLRIGLLGRNLLGRRLGGRVTRIILADGFATVGPHHIDRRVLAFSTRAIRTYQRCGFVEAGHERESAYVEDIWHDDLIMGILDHEFAAALLPDPQLRPRRRGGLPSAQGRSELGRGTRSY